MQSKLLPIALAIMILIGGITVYYSNPVTYVTASDEESNRVAIAEMIINKVSARIDCLLSLAHQYNIEIPQNLTDNIQKSKELLSNASELVNDQPCKAIKLAIEASVVFAPVARYIFKNLPAEAKVNIDKARKEAEVAARIKMVEKLKFLVERLENMSITVPEQVIKDLNNAESLLNSALDKIKTGNYTVHEINSLVFEANQDIRDSIKILHGSFKVIWREASIADISLHLLGRLAFGLEKHINITINLIENNQTDEALEHINAMMHIIDMTLFKINRFSGIIGKLPNEYSSAVDEIKNTLREVYNMLNESKESLMENDTISAITYLRSAFSEIESTLQDLQGLFKDALTYVRHVKGFVAYMDMRFKDWVKNMAMHKLASLATKVGHIEFYLHHAYAKYKAGKLSASQFKNILEHSKTMLKNILDVLNSLDHPPRMLINHIRNIIEWINNVESTLT